MGTEATDSGTTKSTAEGRQSLTGRQVVVCRPKAQAASLVASLAGHGATVLELPLIEVVPAADGGMALDQEVARIDQFDWLACTSANAARAVLVSYGQRAWPTGLRIAAVGPASADVFVQAGIDVDVIADEATAASLATTLRRSLRAGEATKILAPLAELASSDLVDGLADSRIAVTTVEAYRTMTPAHSGKTLEQVRVADAILLSAASMADRLLGLLGGIPTAQLVCIGPQTAARVKALGASVAVVADPHTEAGLIEATVRVLGPAI